MLTIAEGAFVLGGVGGKGGHKADWEATQCDKEWCQTTTFSCSLKSKGCLTPLPSFAAKILQYNLPLPQRGYTTSSFPHFGENGCSSPRTIDHTIQAAQSWWEKIRGNIRRGNFLFPISLLRHPRSLIIPHEEQPICGRRRRILSSLFCSPCYSPLEINEQFEVLWTDESRAHPILWGKLIYS